MKKSNLFLLAILILTLVLGGCGKNKTDDESISQEEAKEIASKYFDLDPEDLEFSKIKKEKDDAILKYELEFKKDRTKYEVELDAKTGEVLSAEKEDLELTGSDQEVIGEDQAKEIVLKKVPGASLDDFIKFKLELDDGKKVYEGELLYSGVEYDFKIEGQTGDIIDWEEEKK